MFPEDVEQVLDGGPRVQRRQPARRAPFGDARIPNPQKDAPPQTILGAEQKAWFKDQLKRATATWKIWGNSLGSARLARRPAEPARWPARQAVAGRASPMLGGWRLWLRLDRARRDLRPRPRRENHRLRDRLGRPAQLLGGLCDVKASAGQVRAGGLELRRRLAVERRARWRPIEHRLPDKFPLRPLYLADRPGGGKARLDLQHAAEARRPLVPRICQELRPRSARAPFRTRELSPHLEFVDMGGHGYATVRLTGDEMRTEFVCIPRPITRSERPDGGPLRYRVVHTAKLWRARRAAAARRSRCSKAIPAFRSEVLSPAITDCPRQSQGW